MNFKPSAAPSILPGEVRGVLGPRHARSIEDYFPLLVRTLESLDVGHVFGVPGTQNVALFESLRRSSLRTVQCTDELGAAFMAVGYSRASGRPGVLATIPGPGFTYALTGLAEARLDSAPVIHLLGVVPPAPHGRFDHQTIPHREIGRPLVKAWLSVGRGEALEGSIRDAFRIATSGDPGPVVVQLGPEGAPTEGAVLRESPLDLTALDRVVRRLRKSVRPLLFLGQGASGVAGPITRLAERLGAPVLTTPSGRGVVSESHALSLGFDPERGDVAVVNEFLESVDVILAVGCRMSHNGTAAFQLELPEGRLVHVNPDPEALGGAYPAGLALRGVAELAIPELLERLAGPVASDWTHEQVAGWRRRLASASSAHAEPRIHGVPGGRPSQFFEELQGALPEDAILVTDSGLHQSLVRRHVQVTGPRRLLLPADFQSMGFGIPAAMGAALALPARRVVAIVGDGGFASSAMELRAAVRDGIPVVVIVFNDGYLNLIRLQQARDYGATHAVEVGGVDYRAFASALGMAYARLDGDPETLRWAVSQRRPVLLEVVVGDSPSLHALRARGAGRAMARRILGPRLLRWVKRALGRTG